MRLDFRIRAFLTAGAVLLVFTMARDGSLAQLDRFAAHLVYPTLLVLTLFMPLVFMSVKTGPTPRLATSYALFFSISVTSVLGLSAPLNGAYAASSNIYIYGLSFYSAYLAYTLATRRPGYLDVFTATNPLLLITGPIPYHFLHTGFSRLKKRLRYYLPYVVIGIFLFKIVASPLTDFLWMIELADPVGTLLYAVIFEIFIYANFAGLSLVIYGVLGILGVRIPLNFRQPFSSRNLVEYWRGWHVSLSVVLKTLFYQPVRKKTYAPVAILAVFLASGLWHGVTLNFVLWGTFHAAMFILTINLLRRGYKIAATLLMAFAIVYGRVMFADTDSARLLQKIFSAHGDFDISALFSVPDRAFLSLAMGLSLVIMEFCFARRKYFRERNYKFLRLPLTQLVLVCIIVLLASTTGNFEYAVYGQR